jgi:hypothetical protein
MNNLLPFNIQIVSKELLEKIASIAIQSVAIVWRLQGHELTGNAVRQLETRIVERGNDTIIEGYVIDYMAELNEGVPASKIPRPGTAAYDKLITELAGYARKRGLTGRRTYEQIARAIARRYLREGKPTKASARFSKTGKRTGFIEQALSDIEPELAKLIEQGVEESINFVIESFFKTQLNR